MSPDQLNPGSDPTVNVSVDHASDVQTARYSAPLSPTGIHNGAVRTATRKSRVQECGFISVLRVSPVNYLIYLPNATGSNPVTDHETARLSDICGSSESQESAESANDQSYRLNENNPDGEFLSGG